LGSLLVIRLVMVVQLVLVAAGYFASAGGVCS
jgi:hypothetical protein